LTVEAAVEEQIRMKYYILDQTYDHLVKLSEITKAYVIPD